jgi:large subunit ribosomal protein L9
MQIILLQDVEKLGLRGDVVDVARGYARNYLLPRRMAEVATPARVKEMQRVEAERARHEARSAEQAEQIADVLRKTVLRFEVKSGPTGSLFGSVTPSDIADEIWRTRKVRIDRRKIAMDPIKRIGRYAVPVEVFQDVQAEVKTLVVPEGGELPPEEELAALEAAEAEAAAAAAVEAETEHAEAEHAIAEVVQPETSSGRVLPRLSPQVCRRRAKVHAVCGCFRLDNLGRPVDSASGVGDNLGTYVPFSLQA